MAERTMTDHEWYLSVKAGEDEGWQLVRELVVEPEAKSMRSMAMMQRFSLTTEDLLGMLYDEMIGRGKIALYRDDGGSFQGWLRTYVRGYVLHAKPNQHGEISLEGGRVNEAGESEALALPDHDHELIRQEVWRLTHYCFRELWNKDPERCYVHVLKTRYLLSSEEIRDFLEMSSAANVDQVFSRSVKFMRKRYATHDVCRQTDGTEKMI